jgi:hypothetical protein
VCVHASHMEERDFYASLLSASIVTQVLYVSHMYETPVWVHLCMSTYTTCELYVGNLYMSTSLCKYTPLYEYIDAL